MEAAIEKALKDYLTKIPSLPTSVTKVLEVCNNPKTSPSDLNQVISLDPVLAGRVLKLINSAYCGLGQPVTSLVRAIIMLGINTVKNLALSTAVVGNLSAAKVLKGLNMENFWRHSLGSGVSAKILAKKRNIAPVLVEEYFTAGLLHDIGKIPLNAILTQDYMMTVKTAGEEGKPLSLAEENAFGVNHCEAGAMIVEAWKLSGAIGDVITYHHNYTDYTGDHKDILYSIAAANRFVSLSEIGFSGDSHPIMLPQVIWDALEIDQDIFDGFGEDVHHEISKAEIFLKIGLSGD